MKNYGFQAENHLLLGGIILMTMVGSKCSSPFSNILWFYWNSSIRIPIPIHKSDCKMVKHDTAYNSQCAIDANPVVMYCILRISDTISDVPVFQDFNLEGLSYALPGFVKTSTQDSSTPP